MRVLHLLDSVNRGGAEAQALDVCRNASGFGLEMTLVTAHGGSLEREFQESGADYVRLGRKLPIDLSFAKQIRKIIKEREIEIVHGYQAVDGMHLYLAARGLKNVRRVLSFQGYIADRRNRLASKFLIPRMDANIALVNAINYCSQRDRAETIRMLREAVGGNARILLDPRFGYTIFRLLKTSIAG